MNIFLSNDAVAHATRIAAVRSLDDGRLAMAVAENIVRPAAGGQPQDAAMLETSAGMFRIERVFKEAGETWLTLDTPLPYVPEAGDAVTLHVDGARRLTLSRAHSLTHLAMAAIRELVPQYESKGADLSEDGRQMELRFRASEAVDADTLAEIDQRTRSLVLAAIPITVARVKSTSHAEAQYDKWRVDPDLNLSGKIRVINIANIDVNPCSGSHVASTAEIGAFGMLGHRVNGLGINLLRLRLQENWNYWY